MFGEGGFLMNLSSFKFKESLRLEKVLKKLQVMKSLRYKWKIQQFSFEKSVNITKKCEKQVR